MSAAALLSELPAALRDRLDLAELAPAGAAVDAACRKMGETLGAHVVAYRPRPAGAPARGPQLCGVLVPARVPSRGLDLLRAAERELGGDVTLVAYARPVRLRRAGTI